MVSVHPFHWRDETIAPARERLNQRTLRSRVAESFTQLGNRFVQAVIEIDKGIRRPELASQLLPGHQLSRAFKQNPKHLKRLLL
jgi:hypothetical protein